MSEEKSKAEEAQSEVAKVEVKDAAAEPERAEWGNHCEFFLTSLGLAVGLGNIWRFPYKCYVNGGGTFLIPYLIMLAIVGLPLFFMEMALGQYAGLSAPKIYSRLAPGLRGLGYGMVTIPTVMNFYYTVVMAYAVYFLFMGFNTQLPWDECNHSYNTKNCYSLPNRDRCNEQFNDSSTIFWNLNCTKIEDYCKNAGEVQYEKYNNSHCYDPTSDIYFNGTGLIPLNNVTFRKSASEEFWYIDVLGLKVNFTMNGTLINTDESSWENWGNPNWKIMGCLLLCWTLVCLSLIKGISSYGKVVYFTTIFPYVVLTTLLIYVSTLDGFNDGISYYLTPDWEKLTDLNVWNEGAGQIFYSMGVAVGSQLLLSSFNGFKTNCHRDALLIGLCNSTTSIYAGLVVFGTVGFIADKKGMEIDKVVDAGPGLAFIVYPEAVSAMAVSPLFSFMFFFMLVLLAISSVCGSWEAMISAVMDEIPKLRKKRVYVMICSCLFAFCMGVPMCFDAGFLLFNMMDTRTANSIVIMAFLELIVISWFYGVDRFFGHIDEMGMWIPGPLRVFWKTCWVVITPILIGFITVSAWINKKKDFFLDYEYPAYAQFLGWGIELLAVSCVILYGAYTIIKKAIQGKDVSFLKPGPMLTPKDSWGPRPDSGLPTVAQVNAAFEGE